VAPAGPDAIMRQSEKVPEPYVPNTFTVNVVPTQLTMVPYITFAVRFALIIRVFPVVYAVCVI
jgi:hypothetical protein